MKTSDWKAVLEAATEPALRYLESLPERRVYPAATPDEIRSVLARPLPEHPMPAEEVVADLAREVEPFITAHSCGRFFGFVMGGLHPASYGAELLTSSWDQNAGLYGPTPGVAILEEVACTWILDLLRLPRDASVGLVTGGQMASFTCLAAARDAVLRGVEWDVEEKGLQGAPKVNVVVKSEKHSTVARALRFLGLGYSNAVEVASDRQSRLDTDDLGRTLENLKGPTIICAEAGNVNTGCFDAFDRIADVVDAHRERGNPSWVHVDGAVGLWALAAPSMAPLVQGLDRLDSWSTDAHKLLNVAYDCGVAICRDAAAHRAATSVHASYLVHAGDQARDAMDWNPEFSRRARGTGVYATLRSLGRTGVVEIVERTVALARLFATELEASGKAKIVNDVVFNQVLVQWRSPGADHDDFNDRVIQRMQQDGTAFFSGTTWNGMRLMRISVSDWATDESDMHRAIEALFRAASAG